LSLRAISRTYPEDGGRIFLRNVGISLPNRILLSEILYAVFISALLASYLNLMNNMSDVSVNTMGGNGHWQVIFVWTRE
jgi:hypothetical protein